MRQNAQYWRAPVRDAAWVRQLLSQMGVSEDEFAAINGKRADEIRPGETVYLPCCPPGCAGGRFTRIKSGETLLLLAKRAQSRVYRLLAANPYLNPGHCAAGQVVVIPHNAKEHGVF